MTGGLRQHIELVAKEPQSATRTHEFTIPLCSPLPSPNDRMYHHKRARLLAKLREDVYLVACSKMTELGIPTAQTDEFRQLSLTLLRGKGQRILDADNAVASMKVILDALSRPSPKAPGALLIADDDRKHVAVQYGPQERAATPGVRVVVEWEERG